MRGCLRSQRQVSVSRELLILCRARELSAGSHVVTLLDQPGDTAQKDLVCGKIA
jgi:hypothetical protein